jgi:iron(III) transport system ATP-binding protein
MSGITIEGLSKSYGREATMAAVSNLSLDVADGSFVTLLGPSGCGKTTTLRLIAGFIAPDSGMIHAGGVCVSSPGKVVPPEHRGMGMVFQNYAVWPHKTVYENVVFGLKLRGVKDNAAKRKVEEALALVNLTGLEGRYPSALSGGQQQRVALARSLVVEPGILLLDEPLSNLDAKLRERMRVELKQLQRRTGITFIYVTHDQAEAMALSDKVAVIHGGKLQQYGSPEDVYMRPANRLVADFMGLVNIITGEVVAIDGGARLVVSPAMAIDLGEVPNATQGTRIDVAVRPENIALTEYVDPQVTLPARVIERTFLGNLSEYIVEIQGGPSLRVQTHPLQHHDVGSTIGVAIAGTRCIVLDGSASTNTS